MQNMRRGYQSRGNVRNIAQMNRDISGVGVWAEREVSLSDIILDKSTEIENGLAHLRYACYVLMDLLQLTVSQCSSCHTAYSLPA
jgi:hypothetical protein